MASTALTNEAIVKMVKDKLEQKNRQVLEYEKRIANLEKELAATRIKAENGDNLIVALEEILKSDK